MQQDTFECDAVRFGSLRSQFKEHSEALYLSSSFVFDNAQQAADLFAGEQEGYFYSRFENPNLTMLQQRLAKLEGAESCMVTSTGMSAILSVSLGLLKSGDHVIAAKGLFGATQSFFETILPNIGIEASFIDMTCQDELQQAIRPNSRFLFIETPSNPLTYLADITQLAQIAHQSGLLLIVDNTLCTSALLRPIELGADIVVYSATKYLDGQGRVLGGAVLGTQDKIDAVGKFVRTTGASLSPFNAWIIFKGLETLKLRMDAQSANAYQLAQWLSQQKGVKRVYYPALEDHPQHKLAKKLLRASGPILSFEVAGERSAAWKVIDQVKILSITANMGDTRSTITHPFTTTHGKVSAQVKEAAGIREGLIRIAVGLESVNDLQTDLDRGLSLIA